MLYDLYEKDLNYINLKNKQSFTIYSLFSMSNFIKS